LLEVAGYYLDSMIYFIGFELPSPDIRIFASAIYFKEPRFIILKPQKIL